MNLYLHYEQFGHNLTAIYEPIVKVMWDP
jgi:hypothetical protein